MPYKVVINPPVFEDIEKAEVWFNKKREGLGDIFLDTLFEELDSLETRALHCQVRYDDIRMLHLHKYYYSIHYRVFEELKTVLIEAVVGMREDPKEWRTIQ